MAGRASAGVSYRVKLDLGMRCVEKGESEETQVDRFDRPADTSRVLFSSRTVSSIDVFATPQKLFNSRQQSERVVPSATTSLEDPENHKKVDTMSGGDVHTVSTEHSSDCVAEVGQCSCG